MAPTPQKKAASASSAAGPAIKGYKYQFDKTVIELLLADDDAIITIEGIEDYDRESGGTAESVQSKYLEAQSFSLSLIRDAIVPMLSNSVMNTDRRYKLYIH